MPRASTRIPKHCLHRRSGRGYVTLNGKHIPTGRYGAPEAEDAYSRILTQWLMEGRQAPPAPGGSHDTTISDLVARYWRFAEKKYSVAGRPTGELANVRYALSYLLRSDGLLPATEFGPLRLKKFQSSLAESGLCRTTVNKIVGHARRMIRWAVSEELVAPDAYYALSAVE